MVRANPLLGEQFRNHFADRRVLKLYRTYLIVLALTVPATWPSNSVSYYLQFSSKPITLPFTFLVMFIFSFFLTLLSEKGGDERQNTLIDLVRFTPVGIPGAYFGQILFFSARSIFILLLPTPLLITAATASGLALSKLIAACVVVAVFCIFSKILVFAASLLFYRRPFPRVLTFVVFIIFAVLLSVRFLPAANPILAVQSLIGGSETVGSLDSPIHLRWTDTVLLYIGAAAAVSLVSISFLFRLRREVRERQ